ncbi:MAG: MBL fold metallo-hydrolase [Christensenellales bacterium]|jgi:L-ascorbate metabolism protein UlaG (beta-lactamase superfamily)
MVIEWLGHSCFKVTVGNETKILFDPYDDTIGYPHQDVEADIVVISHAHFDHNDLSLVKGKYSVVKTQGVHQFGNLKIEGVKTWHDHSQGRHRGENLAFMLFTDGIKLCHMGDIGCIPSEEVYKKIEGTDILLIPVGGHYTIDAKEALTICERLSPNIIIPMHFKTPASTLDIALLDDFLEASDREYDVSRPGKCYLEIDKTSLKKRTRIVVMEYL